MKKVILIVILVSMLSPLIAQEVISEKASDEFSISLEFRPRVELRNGYRQLPNDTTQVAFFTSQRSRLNINYSKPGLNFHTSIQDIRVWGEDDPRSTNGTLQVFETYIEPSITKNLSVRIGRQKIMYDNQRLFAQNNWRQNGGSHDAVRLIFKTEDVHTELIGAFNQMEEKIFGTDYDTKFDNYKVLLANFLNYRVSEPITLTTLNATDGYQDEDHSNITHFRFTHGGRIEYEKQNIYLTLAGYYQHGKTSEGQDLSAFYFQPEIRYKPIGRATLRLGAEIFSGDDATSDDEVSHSFDALYGVNHRFLGKMDYFTRFPKDFNNAGLIDPYLFIFYDLSRQLSFRVDGHLFYSENKFVVDDKVIDKYLGFENDLSLTYLPNDFTTVDLGFSWMLAEKSMEWIKGGGNSDKIPYWSYLMITFKPELFKWSGQSNH